MGPSAGSTKKLLFAKSLSDCDWSLEPIDRPLAGPAVSSDAAEFLYEDQTRVPVRRLAFPATLKSGYIGEDEIRNAAAMGRAGKALAGARETAREFAARGVSG